MKKVVFLSLVLIGSYIQAQGTRTKTVGEFSELKVFDKIIVDVIKASENKVEVSGIKKDEVDIVLKDNVLKIKMSLNNAWDTNNTKVTVYYSSLSKIDVNEGAKVTVKEVLESSSLDLRAQEGGNIIATIKADRLVARAVTGGELVLKGNVKLQEVTVKAGGQFLSEDLKTETTQVKISAGGRANIYATEYVKANTAAGGTIRVYGNPKKIDEKKVFGGKIIRIN